MTTVLEWQRAILEAAEQRGWTVVQFDIRGQVVVLEEPMAGGLVLRVQGRDVEPEFILALPEARQPRE